MKPFLLDQLADIDMLELALGRRCYRGEVLCMGGFACPGGTGHEDDREFSGVVGGHRATYRCVRPGVIRESYAVSADSY